METFDRATNRKASSLTADPRFLELVNVLRDQLQDRVQALFLDLENQQVAEDLVSVLREAIDESGKSQYQLAQETGIDKSALSRFVSGERGLTLDTAAKLAAVLGLELKPARRRRRGQRA